METIRYCAYYGDETSKGHKSIVVSHDDEKVTNHVRIEVTARTHEESINKAKRIAEFLNNEK